jgi:hypothetical protein
MERKFKAGDVVKCIKDGYKYVKNGCYYVVADDQVNYVVNIIDCEGEGCVYAPSSFELVHPATNDDVITSGAVVSDGGSSSYYQLTITNKAGESLQCETGDILRALVGNDYDLSNIVKACRRSYEASQGRGKAGASIEYDMNKVKYFADEFAHWNKAKDKEEK